MEMLRKKILGVPIDNLSEIDILEKILKYMANPKGFFHITSLNPENLVIAQENAEFKKVLLTSQIRIADGIGIVVAAQILDVELKGRVSGVDLMEKLIRLASDRRLRVLLIGGRPNLALRLAECYQKKYTEAKFLGTIGFSDIKKPSKDEAAEIFSIVRHFKPHLIFASFGSPEQELWLARHDKELSGIVVMGVGGAFDYFGKIVPRAPRFLRTIGLEWLFRLVVQPWRWKRQLRLITFVWLIILQKFNLDNGERNS